MVLRGSKFNEFLDLMSYETNGGPVFFPNLAQQRLLRTAYLRVLKISISSSDITYSKEGQFCLTIFGLVFFEKYWFRYQVVGLLNT
jgi:hypothetical protein